MFNRLLGYIGGGILQGFLSRRERQRDRDLYDLYTQAQLNILQAEEAHFDDEYYSSSMSSWQSSTSSESTSEEEEVIARVESNALGTPYFASLEKRMKKMGLEEDEFFKKEEFDI